MTEPGTLADPLLDEIDLNYEGRRVVAIGEFRDGMVEIRSGLDAGDVVVTRGHTELIDGAAVRVTTPGGESSELANRAGAPLVGKP